jgi:hypothetical protein
VDVDVRCGVAAELLFSVSKVGVKARERPPLAEEGESAHRSALASTLPDATSLRVVKSGRELRPFPLTL